MYVYVITHIVEYYEGDNGTYLLGVVDDFQKAIDYIDRRVEEVPGFELEIQTFPYGAICANSDLREAYIVERCLLNGLVD